MGPQHEAGTDSHRNRILSRAGVLSHLSSKSQSLGLGHRIRILKSGFLPTNLSPFSVIGKARAICVMT